MWSVGGWRNPLTPVIIPTVFDMVQLVAGGMHTAVLILGGEVYTFGCNDEGALG